VELDEPESLEKTLADKWLLDQFRIVKSIGGGGMGAVFLAEQAAMDRNVVVKVLRQDGICHEEMKQRFRREARALSKLMHPNIVTVFAAGETSDGLLFLAMEYVEGISLEARLAKGPPIPGDTIDIILQCARALAHAHSKQIVHRDFKPGNVMLTLVSSRIHVKVLDFGIARLEKDSSCTQSGSLLGTPRYMSPEQCRGETATPLSDQYALGLVLHEMLTGQPAIVADCPLSYLHLHQSFMPPPPSQARPGLEPLDPVVMRMLAKDARARFPSMEQVCDAITAAAAELPRQLVGAATPPPSVPRASLGVAKTQSVTRLLSLGSGELLSKAARDLLEARSFVVQKQIEEPAALLGRAAGDYDLCLLALPGVCCDLLWNEWTRVGVLPQRTLVCIDAELASEELAQQARLFCNVLISPFPVEPVALYNALACLRQGASHDGDSLLSEQGAEVVRILSTAERGQRVESMLEAAGAAGVRSSVREKLRDIADEMIMNAIFHAPISADGRRSYGNLNRASQLTLRPDEAVTFRWAVRDPFFVLGVRDNFGSIEASTILKRLTGPTPRPRVGESRMGTGVGLRVMSQHSHHLLFTISPGHRCEVVALVDRQPAQAGRERTLAIVQHGELKHRLGDRLTCTEYRYQREIHVKLTGQINETADLGPVFRHTGTMWLDLSEVTSINSVGIRNWLEGAAQRDKDLLVLFKACSPAIVRQLNMIPLFAATGNVHSFLAPYFCQHCKIESLQLLPSTIEEYPPARRCPECSADLSFDDVVEEYFAFLTPR
jgi:serine/threonine protein kinase